MRSLLIFTVSLLITTATFAQKTLVGLKKVSTEKVSTKSGVLKFEASTENFEPVAAINKTTSAILKPDGNLAVLGLIKGFQFKKKLMQEHFNQAKFMNSKEFPKAKFSGKLVNYKGAGEYELTGKLTIHGVSQEINTYAVVQVEDGVVYLNTKFSVLVADYGINIKSKLAKKIAEKVNIEVNLELK